ncbi:MAG: alpha/beta fold hydrolase [Planctomycetaceae bacterium]
MFTYPQLQRVVRIVVIVCCGTLWQECSNRLAAEIETDSNLSVVQPVCGESQLSPLSDAETPSNATGDAVGTENEVHQSDETSEKEDHMFPKLPDWATRIKTLGGRQFWGDCFYCSGWRIQRNVMTGHCRLLDPDDCRCASGTEAVCRAEFVERRKKEGIPAMKGRAVVLVHGIIRSSKSFDPLEKQLASKGWNVVGFDYPSTRVPIAESARYLAEVLKSLEGIEEIDLVVHSMGGLVVRSYIQQCGEQGPDKRIRRMVMLGVPNKGASMANKFQNNVLFKTIYGPAGQELIEGEETPVAALPTPPFEFAVIAGGRGAERGYNPLLKGDNDGTVAVESTRLPGAADFILIPSMHSFLMSNEEVIDCTERFLKSGALRKSGAKTPIPLPGNVVDSPK